MVIVWCQWWNSIRSSVILSASWFRKYFQSLSVEMIHQYAFQIYRDSDLLHYEIVVLISKVITTTFLLIGWLRIRPKRYDCQTGVIFRLVQNFAFISYHIGVLWLNTTTRHYSMTTFDGKCARVLFTIITRWFFPSLESTILHEWNWYFFK